MLVFALFTDCYSLELNRVCFQLIEIAQYDKFQDLICITLFISKSAYDSVLSYAWQGPSWPWSYGNWIYKYLCNQCLSPLMFWVRISIRERCTTLCDKVCQWLVTGRWFSLGPPVSSTNKTDRHDRTDILLKVSLNTIKQTNKQKSAYDIVL